MASFDEAASHDEADSDGEPELTTDALSASTLAALREHLAEAEAEVQQRARDEGDAADTVEAGASIPKEDFHLSQFWYDDATAARLAAALVALAPADGRIAVVSCPSVMYPLARADAGAGAARAAVAARAVLLEIDRRFAGAFGERFAYFDYNRLDELPATLRGECDVVLVDPPYVSDECVGAFAVAATRLARSPIADGGAGAAAADGGGADGGAAVRPFTPCVFITSEVMRGALAKALPGMRMTAFELTFQSKLSTPLRVYANVSDEAAEAHFGGWAADFDEPEAVDAAKR